MKIKNKIQTIRLRYPNHIIYEFSKDHLWHGNVRVRSLTLDKARLAKKSLIVIWQDEYIEIPFERFWEGYKNKQLLHSIHSSDSYYLIDFDWSAFNPQKIQKQEPLFNNLQPDYHT